MIIAENSQFSLTPPLFRVEPLSYFRTTFGVLKLEYGEKRLIDLFLLTIVSYTMHNVTERQMDWQLRPITIPIIAFSRADMR